MPKPVKAGSDRHSSLPHPSSSELPNTLLAKYGGDVVLRFNLSTPVEEQALAEAADTLFLDVWAFTQNWADIRLREDDVRRSASRSLDSTIHVLIKPLGSLTSRIAAKVTPEGIFQSDAGLSQDNLPIVPINCLCRPSPRPESYRPVFHTSFKDFRWSGEHILSRLSTLVRHRTLDEADGLDVHNPCADDQHWDNL